MYGKLFHRYTLRKAEAEYNNDGSMEHDAIGSVGVGKQSSEEKIIDKGRRVLYTINH